MVILIAGGMTSQLTYDGIDVCASRVAWEVSHDSVQSQRGYVGSESGRGADDRSMRRSRSWRTRARR